MKRDNAKNGEKENGKKAMTRPNKFQNRTLHRNFPNPQLRVVFRETDGMCLQKAFQENCKFFKREAKTKFATSKSDYGRNSFKRLCDSTKEFMPGIRKDSRSPKRSALNKPDSRAEEAL